MGFIVDLQIKAYFFMMERWFNRLQLCILGRKRISIWLLMNHSVKKTYRGFSLYIRIREIISDKLPDRITASSYILRPVVSDLLFVDRLQLFWSFASLFTKKKKRFCFLYVNVYEVFTFWRYLCKMKEENFGYISLTFYRSC